MFISIKLSRAIFIILLFTCFLFFCSAGVTGVFFDKEEEGISLPILMYHHILKDKSKHGAYVISPDEFEADLIYLKENGYTTITIADLINLTQDNILLPEKPVMITFDDGYLSTLEYAYPLLEKYNMKAVISVIAKYSEEYSQNYDRHVPYAHLTWEDLSFMQKSGVFEVQNHTYDMHKNKSGARHGSKRVSGESLEHYEAEFKKDVSLAQDLLFKNSGINATCFTYPFGMISDESIDFVKDMGFSASLSCFEGINYITENPDSLYLLKRYNRAHNRHAKKILEN